MLVTDLGIDFSGANIPAATAAKDGARFGLRYSAGVGNGHADVQWKLCEPGTIAAFAKAGVDFIANSEWYESRITEGAPAGHADGAADLVFWQSRGLAKGACIYVSWDQFPAESKWAGADEYLLSYRAALKGYYGVGAYAGTAYLKHALAKGIIRYGWRPNAGSWSNDGLPYQPDTSTAAKRSALVKLAWTRTPAAIWQTGNYWYSKTADENLMLKSACGSHLQAQAKPPPPKPVPAPPLPAKLSDADFSAAVEEVMAMTPAQRAALVQEIAAAVWNWDHIAEPPGSDPKNPTWAPASYLRNTYVALQSLSKRVK